MEVRNDSGAALAEMESELSMGKDCECRSGWNREALSVDWQMRELKVGGGY